MINFVKHWIENYYEEDFSNNPELHNSLKELIDLMVKTNKRFGQIPLKTLQRKMANYVKPQQQQQQQQKTEIPDDDDFNNLRIMFKSTYSSSSSSSSANSSRSSSASDVIDQSDVKSSNTVLIDDNRVGYNFPPFETHLEDQYSYDILTIHPLEFARQATLMEQEIFKEIKVKFFCLQVTVFKCYISSYINQKLFKSMLLFKFFLQLIDSQTN